MYDIPKYTKSKENPPESARLYSLDLPGHRTDVRTLSLSSDDTLLASASNGTLGQLTVGDLTTILFRFNQDMEYAHYVLHPHVGMRPLCMQCISSRRPIRPFCTILRFLVVTISCRSSSGQNQEKCRFLISRPRPKSRPLKRTRRHYGPCISGRISKLWSREALTRMSNFGT